MFSISLMSRIRMCYGVVEENSGEKKKFHAEGKVTLHFLRVMSKSDTPFDMSQLVGCVTAL